LAEKKDKKTPKGNRSNKRDELGDDDSSEGMESPKAGKKTWRALNNKFTNQNTVKKSHYKSMLTLITNDKLKRGSDWMNMSEKAN
jgi:hypothetical protein